MSLLIDLEILRVLLKAYKFNEHYCMIPNTEKRVGMKKIVILSFFKELKRDKMKWFKLRL